MCHLVVTWTPGAQFSPFEIAAYLNMGTHSGRLITIVTLGRRVAGSSVTNRLPFLGCQRVEERCWMQESYVTGLYGPCNSSLTDS
jgi:hypothetical protein